MAKLGGTGDFPRGKLNDSDEGGLQLGVATRDKTVIVNFGKPVAWIGLDKASALQLSDLIRKHAEKL